jgi:cell division protein FtsL
LRCSAVGITIRMQDCDANSNPTLKKYNIIILDRIYIMLYIAQVMNGLEIIQWKLLRKTLQKENKTKVKKKKKKNLRQKGVVI